ncbi:MAG: hypothetical protein FJ244_05590 [Nitrospira sp.]|nr:hypothetical protein [Nitrospira sp.]
MDQQANKFNFVLTGGAGVSWFLTPQLAANLRCRFHHISNAGKAFPNLRLNASLSFGGFSFYF